MKELKSVVETVNSLTEEQKEKVLKANRYGIIAMIITTLLCLGTMLFSVIVFLKTPKAHLHFDKFVIVIVSIVVIGLALCFVEYFFIKKKVPYYSDKVCVYIRKSRKKEKNK